MHEVLVQGAAKLVLVIAAGQLLFLFLLLNLARQLVDGLGQLGAAQRLEQVKIHAQGNGLLGVFKIIKTADDDNLDPRHHGLEMAHQLKSVQKGHFNIRQQDIRHEVLHHGKRHFTVGSLPAKGIGPRQAFNHIAYALADQQLILYHKDLVHGRPSLMLFIIA